MKVEDFIEKFNELFLGPTGVLDVVKITAQEKFGIDPSSVQLVPVEGAVAAIKAPLSQDQWEQLINEEIVDLRLYNHSIEQGAMVFRFPSAG